MVEVTVKNGEQLERALRRFKKKVGTSWCAKGC